MRPRAVLLASLLGVLLVALLFWIWWPSPFTEKPSSPELLAEAEKIFEAGNDAEAVKKLGRLAAREPWSRGLVLLVGSALGDSKRFVVNQPGLGLMWVAADWPGENVDDLGRRFVFRARFQNDLTAYRAAIATVDQAVRLALKNQHRADLHFQKSRSLESLGDLRKANLEIEKARALYEKEGSAAGIAQCLELKLIVDLAAGRSGEAEEVFEAILEIYWSDTSGGAFAGPAINLASLLSKRGQFATADRLFTESIGRLGQLDLPFELGFAYLGRAINRQWRAQIDSARRDYVESARYFRLAQADEHLSMLLVNLGKLEIQAGNLVLAEWHFEESFRVAPQERTPIYAAYSHLQRAELYRRKKNWQAAAADLEAAMTLYNALPAAQRDESYWAARIAVARNALARQNFGTAIAVADGVLQELRAALSENPGLLESPVVFERASARLMLARALIEQPSPSAAEIQEANTLLGQVLADSKIQQRPLLVAEARTLRKRTQGR